MRFRRSRKPEAPAKAGAPASPEAAAAPDAPARPDAAAVEAAAPHGPAMAAATISATAPVTAPATAAPGHGALRLAFLGDPNSVQTRRWIGYFLDRGHDVHLLVPEHDPMVGAPDPRITVHRFEAWPKRRPPGVGSFVTMRALRRTIRSIHPDVLHAQSGSRNTLAAWLSRFHPYVVTVWGSDVLTAPRRTRLGRWQTRRSLRAADLVTAGSQHLVEAAIEAGARPERTRYIHFGVDTDRFSPGPAPDELRDRLHLAGWRVVLSPRTIAPLYHQSTVVEALEALPRDVAVVMTRHLADPAEVARIEAQADRLTLAERVRIVPRIDHADMPDYYRLADVVVSVPESDGGPNTIVEALATGRPVVATDLPPVREWLADLDPRSLVPVGDSSATAHAIMRILARDQLDATDLATRGRAAVVSQADQRSTMAEMETVYRELAAQRRKARGRGKERRRG